MKKKNYPAKARSKNKKVQGIGYIDFLIAECRVLSERYADYGLNAFKTIGGIIMWKRIWNRAKIEKSYEKMSENKKDIPEYNLDDIDLLNYYWNYFELQSQQRNQTCGLYFTLLIALVTGYVTAVHLRIVWAEYVALIAIIVIAYAFGLMFFRTTKLRNNVRNRIQEWEKAHISTEKCRLFDGTEETNKSKFTYSNAFLLQFYVVCIVSFAMIMLTLSEVLPF